MDISNKEFVQFSNQSAVCDRSFLFVIVVRVLCLVCNSCKCYSLDTRNIDHATVE